jgi:hypothetical protein
VSVSYSRARVRPAGYDLIALTALYVLSLCSVVHWSDREQESDRSKNENRFHGDFPFDDKRTPNRCTLRPIQRFLNGWSMNSGEGCFFIVIAKVAVDG